MIAYLGWLAQQSAANVKLVAGEKWIALQLPTA